MKRIVFAFLSLFPSLVFAGNVADIFDAGVFGVKWGASVTDVQTAFPGGKLEEQYGVASYLIKDGRPLFDIERAKENLLRFSFDANGVLIGVGIEFPLESSSNFSQLLTKLETHFGKSQAAANSLGATMVKWPEDNGTAISLVHVSGVFSLGSLLFGIEHRLPIAPVSKKALGF